MRDVMCECICKRQCVTYAVVMAKEPMKNRVIRIPEALWEKAKERADEKGETVSEAVRKFLERYVR